MVLQKAVGLRCSGPDSAGPHELRPCRKNGVPEFSRRQTRGRVIRASTETHKNRCKDIVVLAPNSRRQLFKGELNALGERPPEACKLMQQVVAKRNRRRTRSFYLLETARSYPGDAEM